MSFLFFIVVVAGLPFLSALSYRNIRKLEAEHAELHLQKTPLYLQAIALQLIMAGLALLAAYFDHLPVSFNANWNLWSVMAAIAFITISLSLAWWSNKQDDTPNDSTLRYLLPDRWQDRLLWITACAIAAVCEEYVYRGVLFQMAMNLTGNSWPGAVAICAVVFAFGHGTQGQRAILQIIPFAVGFHLIVHLSGGLLVAIVTHFCYNVLVDLLFGKEIRNKPGTK